MTETQRIQTEIDTCLEYLVDPSKIAAYCDKFGCSRDNAEIGALAGLADWNVEQRLMQQQKYGEFLRRKRILAEPCGFSPSAPLNSMLFPFQRDVVRFDLERGKAANFAHTGLGKGPMQMEWCSHVSEYAKGNTLIVAPLAVAQQFKREARKFGYSLTVCRDQSDVRTGLNVTNYERLDLFDLPSFVGVSLDESSCIKDFSSKTTKSLIEKLAATPYKLANSATPSPNDHAELGTHTELLDVMRRSAMLAMFFEHDGGETSKWTLKGHGKRSFWKFVASWAVCVKRPSDLGYPDGGFELPPLNLHEHIVAVDHGIHTDGMLFRCPDLSATGLHKEMRITAEDRARKVAELVSSKPDVPWLLWCNTNYEADAIKAVLPQAVDVRGSDSPEKKEAALIGFADGNIQIMLSKPGIAGFGMNYQHCADMAFVGLSYSFENLFQAIRRCWRFGQTKPVSAHLVIAETEGAVLDSIRRKERQYEELQSEMNQAMREEQLATRHKATRYDHAKEMRVPRWL